MTYRIHIHGRNLSMTFGPTSKEDTTVIVRAALEVKGMESINISVVPGSGA